MSADHLERIKPGHYYVVRNAARVGHVWKGCGGWAGSRYSEGIEVTAHSAKATAERLLALTPHKQISHTQGQSSDVL